MNQVESKLYKKKAIRLVTNSAYIAHTTPLFIEEGLLKVQDIFKLKLLKFYYKLSNNLLPPYFESYRDVINREPPRALRQHFIHQPMINTGIKEMLNICEKYARKYDILFNATKSQLLYFGKDSNNDNIQSGLSMDNGKKIPYVTKCLHLGNSISTTDTKRSMINNAIADLNIKSNNLLADISFSSSSTLSVLFKSYCMNVYGSALWRYNNHSNIEKFCVSWRKIVRRLWKIPYRTHNSLVHLINKCDSINCILEKRCVKFLWNLFNSDNVLFSRIIRYSMHNSDTTIGENVRYFMYKYKIVYNDWFNDLSTIYIIYNIYIIFISYIFFKKKYSFSINTIQL